MKRLKLALMAAGVLLCISAMPVQAQGIWQASSDVGTPSTTICGDKTEAQDVIKNIINLMLYIIGILSVVMIIHSGLKYVNSRGDAEGVKSAKNTLLYSVVGLIVAMLAFTIVNFVIDAFKSSVVDTTSQATQGIKLTTRTLGAYDKDKRRIA